jgi:hypothetical protein
MTRTGKFVTESENDRLQSLFQRTLEPVFGATTRQTFNAAQRVDDAVTHFYSEVDRAAVELGLPEPGVDQDGDVIHYGLDFSNREIVAVC